VCVFIKQGTGYKEQGISVLILLQASRTLEFLLHRQNLVTLSYVG